MTKRGTTCVNCGEDRPRGAYCPESLAGHKFERIPTEVERLRGTLAAVREWARGIEATSPASHNGRSLAREVLTILDGEGEKCPTCAGRGIVATSGPDEFGNYETDDCPDDFHR